MEWKSSFRTHPVHVRNLSLYVYNVMRVRAPYMYIPYARLRSVRRFLLIERERSSYIYVQRCVIRLMKYLLLYAPSTQNLTPW